jgi:hypothetical protein
LSLHEKPIPQGFEALGIVIFAFYVGASALVAAFVGTVFALIGTVSAAIVRRRFLIVLGTVLALNTLAGPIPSLCVVIAEWIR